MATVTLTSPADGETEVGVSYYQHPVSGVWYAIVMLELEVTGSSGIDKCQGFTLYVDDEVIWWYYGTLHDPYGYWVDNGDYSKSKTLLTQTNHTWYVSWYQENPDAPPAHLWYNTEVRTFTTGGPPQKPVSPKPTDISTGIKLKTNLSWKDGGGAETYDVYVGTSSGNLSLLTSETEATETSSPFLDYYTARYWQVNATNYAGTVEGDEWSYTSMKYCPPLPTGVTLNYGDAPTDPPTEPTEVGTPTGENNIITVRRLLGASGNKFWCEDI